MRITEKKLKTVAGIEKAIKSLFPKGHRYHKRVTRGLALANMEKGRIEILRVKIRAFAKEIGA